MAGRIVSSAVFVLMTPMFTSAQVIITEIMYDLSEGSDGGREWIEVQNTGTESVNLTEWKVYENDTNHGLKAVAGEMLPPGAYAIISDNSTKFAADWPSFSGLMFDSAFSLNNAGEALVLRCCGKEPTDRDSVTYNNTSGGAGDGLSLHRSGSSITAAHPSPGNGSITTPPPAPPEPIAPPPVAKTEQSPPVQQVVQKTEVKQLEEKQQKSVAPTVQTNMVAPASAPLPEPTVVVQEEQPQEQKKKSKNKKLEPIVEDVLEEESETEVIEEKKREVSQVAAAYTMSPSSGDSFLWWAGAAAVSFLGAGGAYMAGRSQRKDEWEISEIE